MSRFLRSFACLVLIGYGGMGVFGMGICICADGHVAIEMVCHGGCQDAEDSPDHQQHGEAEMVAGALADTGGDCVYVPPLADAMLHSLPGSPLAGCLSAGGDFDVRTNTLRVLCRTPSHTSVSVLVQRTIVLRI